MVLGSVRRINVLVDFILDDGREGDVLVDPGRADMHLGQGLHSGLAIRAGTSLLYGTTADQRSAALDAAAPESLPWIAGAFALLARELHAVTGLS